MKYHSCSVIVKKWSSGLSDGTAAFVCMYKTFSGAAVSKTQGKAFV